MTTSNLQAVRAKRPCRVTAAGIFWVLLGGMLTGLTAVTGLCDPDTWWVIADGNRILSGDFSHTNGYSHAFGTHVWHQVEWLSAVVIALSAKVVGLDNLVLLPVMAALAIALVVFDTTRRTSDGVSPVIFLCLLVLLLASLRIRLTARAELFSLLFTPLLLNMWVRRGPKFVWLCGGLGVLWGNLHPGVIYGLGVLCLVVVASLLARDRDASRQAATGAAAFFIGSLCNPFGPLNYWFVLENLFFVQTQRLKINELEPMVLGHHPSFLAAMVVAACGSLLALRRRNYLVLLLLLFFPLALKIKRFAPYPLLLLLPFLHLYAKEAIQSWADKWGWQPIRLVVPSLALVACSLVALTELKIWWPVQPFEWKVNTRVLPAGAADFIDRYNPPANLFNNFNHGGYLAWRFFPQRKIFIDGRLPAYPPEMMNEYADAASGPPDALLALLNKYHMDLALVFRADRVYEHGDFETTFDIIGWELVYIEGAAYVYVRPGSAAAQAIKAPRFTVLKPSVTAEVLHRAAQLSPYLLMEELLRVDPGRLLVLEDFKVFGSAAYSAMRPDVAYSFLAAGMERFPDDNEIKTGAARALIALGRGQEARSLLTGVANQAKNPDEAAEARRILQQMPPGPGPGR